jgi:aryl-alcohol dehydrogenase-like predicted oxidoreductase
MRYRLLGKTGLSVSEVGLGAWELGSLQSKTEAFEVLDKAVELGINFIDTSDNYGQSEIYIGQWLQDRRPHVHIATKISCGPDWALDDMRARLDRSLERLGLETIDIVKMHNPGPDQVKRGDVYLVLEEAKLAGKIRWTGISEDAPTAQACLEMKPYEVLQVDYSMLTRQPEESLFAYTRQHEIGVIARMVFGRFVFQREPHYEWERPMRDRALKMRLIEWFERHAPLSPSELLLRYVLSNLDLHCALVGTTNPKHLEEDVAMAEKGPLPDDILTDFRAWCRKYAS